MTVILVRKEFLGDATFDKLKLWVIPVDIEDEKKKPTFNFLLDTGAERTVITPKVKEIWGLQEVTEKSVRGEGTTGSSQYSTAIASLKIGSIPLIEIKVLVGSLPGAFGKYKIFGILGADILQFLCLKINYPEGILEIERLITYY
ncbi:MAG: retropepsin-like aspartic protease [Trichodesmium sp. MO_231.B1]|nr:retropepsin-like aspartic protease [Trichodesmium sp. MO_231.B1]